MENNTIKKGQIWLVDSDQVQQITPQTSKLH